MAKVYPLGSLFSGIGGLDLAAHWAGFRTAWFVENEPFCQDVLKGHWRDTPIYGDIFDVHNPPFVPVMAGGFPCQPFSIAGQKKGAKDSRYLLPEMLRIVGEVKPYVVLFENVPGFPSLNAGNEFKYLLRALAEMGYNAEWGHLRASDSGAPHTRERWFCVAYSNRIGCGQGGDNWKGGQLLHDFNGNASQSEPEWQGWECGAGAISQNTELGNASGQGLEGQNGKESAFGERTRPDRRAIKSAICGAAYGIPSRMDFPGFPAKPFEQQRDYEPPRVTNEKNKNRKAQLKALGNAVVPQCVYPLFQAIYEWVEVNGL